MLAIKFRDSEKTIWEKRLVLKPKKSQKKIKRKRKTGPKPSGLKRNVQFNETSVGHFLYVYAPIQYHLLMEYSRAIGSFEYGRNIKPAVIETIAINSDNEAFKTARFRRALIAYRRSGMHPLRKTKWTLKDALYYSKHSYKIHNAIAKSTE